MKNKKVAGGAGRDLSVQVTQLGMSLSLGKIRSRAYVMCGPVSLPLSFPECVSFVSLSGQLEPGLSAALATYVSAL